jgi:hypothetical protein
MRGNAVSLLGALVLGFIAALTCVVLVNGRPASAQLNRGLPGGPITTVTPAGQPQMTAQPLAVTSLDTTHFVVASREPRLVTQIGREGTAQNMLLTVVTHYTVRGDRLVGIESVKPPTGYRAVNIEE